MEQTLFTLETPVLKGRNKIIFYKALKQLHNGQEIKISSFTRWLREMGAVISEESVARYLRYLRDWNWGITVESLGKCRYRIIKENSRDDERMDKTTQETIGLGMV